MAFFCHRDISSNNFSCQSQFTPKVVEQISLNPIEKKKDNEVVYLPGERLLIKLGKQQRKIRKKRKDPDLDVDRISKSLSRILIKI
jgi:hypothetical protein